MIFLSAYSVLIVDKKRISYLIGLLNMSPLLLKS